MKAFNVFLSFAISLALFLLLMEGGLRLLGMGPPKGLNDFHPVLGWQKQADASISRSGKGGWAADIAVNEHGLREAPGRGPANPDGAHRVVVLGDSFTLGFTVQAEDVFVEVLERRWNEEGRKVDVVNAGTEAWSTDQEVAWLLEHGEEYAPDLVILAPYENDVFWCSQERYGRTPKPRFTAAGELEARELVDPGAGPLLGRTALGRLFKLGRGPGTPSFEHPATGQRVQSEFAPIFRELPADVEATLADAEARARGALIALKAECAELGADLLVAPVPSHANASDEFAAWFADSPYVSTGLDGCDFDAPVEFFLGAAAELGIATVDARPAMRAAYTAEEPTHLHLEKNGEWHFTPHGNRVYADVLHGAVADLLPAATGTATTIAAAAPTGGGGLPTWLIVYLILFAFLTTAYFAHYKDEQPWQPPLKVGALLAVIFTIFFTARWGLGAMPDSLRTPVALVLVLVILGFVAWKLGNRIATILELMFAFMARGHWYLMPLVVILLTVGSLLVVAASSPLVAPFIYTLF